MKTRLCIALLGMLLLGSVPASALLCMWCDCTMDCTRACRDETTWLPSTCGQYGGLCAQDPECPYSAAETPVMQELLSQGDAPVCPESP